MVLSSRLSARLTKSPGPFIDTCSSLTSPKSRLRPRPALMAALVITVIKAERIMEVFQRRQETEAGNGGRFMKGPASRQPRATLASSVDARNESPGTPPIGVVFGAEALAEQPLLSLDASEHDSEHQQGDDDADSRAERQSPAEHQDNETEIARVANDPVKPAGDQSVFGLDRNQAAEAPAEHEDRREAKNAAARIKEKTDPAHGFAAEGEEIDPVRIGRQISVDNPEHPESGDHPTVGPIFLDARADMALAEQRRKPKCDRDQGHRDQRRIGKEPAFGARPRGRPSPLRGHAPGCGQGKPRLRHGSFLRTRNPMGASRHNVRLIFADALRRHASRLPKEAGQTIRWLTCAAAQVRGPGESMGPCGLTSKSRAPRL